MKNISALVSLHLPLTKEVVDSTTSDYSLRLCQLQAYLSVKAYLDKWQTFGASIKREFIVQMATGTGKTGVISLVSSCIEDFNNVLVLTHSRNIRSQIEEAINPKSKNSFWKKMGVVDPDINVLEVINERIPSTFKSGTRNVVIASIQSLDNQVSKMRKDSYDLVIFDEGHKKGAEKWNQIVEELNCPIMLLTATPFRSNGQTLFDKPIYKYTLADAQASKTPIVKKVLFKTIEEKDIVKQLSSELIAARTNYDLKLGKPRIIFRASSFVNCAKYQKQFDSILKSHNLKTIVLHTTSSENKFPYFKSKTQIDNDYDVIIHEDILIEGYDQPELCILGLQEEIEDARIFIQQVGRIIRHDFKQGLKLQTAIVIAPNKELHERNWLLYSKFEQNSEAYVFRKHNFIPKAGTLEDDILKSILLKPSVLIKKLKRDPSANKLNEINSEIIDWFDQKQKNGINLADKFNDFRSYKNSNYFCYLYQKDSQPSFLSKTAVTNMKWHLLIVIFVDKYVFIQSSDGTLPKPIREFDQCSFQEFDNLLPKRGTNITNIRLENTIGGKHSLRSKSLSSTKVENHVLVSRDGTFNPLRISWNDPVKTLSTESVTLSTRRFSSYKKIGLNDLLVSCVAIKKRLEKKVRLNLHNIFSSVAIECPRGPGKAFYVTLSFDEAIETKLSGGNRYESTMFFDGIKDGNVFILSGVDSGIEIKAKLIEKDEIFSISYATDSLKYEVITEDGTEDLVDFLNDQRAFSILFDDGTCYLGGRFLRPRKIELSDILKYLSISDSFSFNKCKIEMGGKGSDLVFTSKSIFHHVEKYFENYSTDYLLICDDDAGEWADYVFFDYQNRTQILIHCKHDGPKKKPGVRAKSLYEVLGQASKTAHHLNEIPDDERITRWRGNHPKRKYIPRIRNNVKIDESKLKKLCLDPTLKREVWVIQPSISIAKFKAQLADQKGNFHLLSMAVNSAQSNNATFRFFGDV